MSSELSTGRTIVILAVVIGCFAVLWPKVFHPMLTSSGHASTVKVPNFRDPANAHFLAQLCFLVREHNAAHNPLRAVGNELDCVSQLGGTCKMVITEGIIQNYRVLKDKTSLTQCLKQEFQLTPEKIMAAAPPAVKTKPYSPNVPHPHTRPERPSHLSSDDVHPALRQKGRAMPQRTIEKQARPGPLPGIRPPMGGGGYMGPPQAKGTGSMGLIMPVYTVGIIIFFIYTIMKVLFKKNSDEDTNAKLKDFHMDPEYRKYVFAEEYLDSSNTSHRNAIRRQERDASKYRRSQENFADPKIVSTAISGILSELDNYSQNMAKCSQISHNNNGRSDLTNPDKQKQTRSEGWYREKQLKCACKPPETASKNVPLQTVQEAQEKIPPELMSNLRKIVMENEELVKSVLAMKTSLSSATSEEDIKGKTGSEETNSEELNGNESQKSPEKASKEIFRPSEAACTTFISPPDKPNKQEVIGDSATDQVSQANSKIKKKKKSASRAKLQTYKTNSSKTQNRHRKSVNRNQKKNLSNKNNLDPDDDHTNGLTGTLTDEFSFPTSLQRRLLALDQQDICAKGMLAEENAKYVDRKKKRKSKKRYEVEIKPRGIPESLVDVSTDMAKRGGYSNEDKESNASETGADISDINTFENEAAASPIMSLEQSEKQPDIDLQVMGKHGIVSNARKELLNQDRDYCEIGGTSGIEQGTQTDASTKLSVVDLQTSYQLKNQSQNEPSDLDEIHEILLDATIPVDTQLLVQDSQIGSQPSKTILLDSTENENPSCVVTSHVSLAFVGLEQNDPKPIQSLE